jgi:hypothetical protein
MRENDEEVGRYVPLLRRIIILVAVITAVPVILWTITAFVRAYVAPAKLPTFHQLAAAVSTKTEAPPTPEAPKISAPPATPAAKVGENEVLAAKGDRAAESDASAPAPTAMKVASAPAVGPINPKGAEVFPPPQPIPPAANDTAAPNTAMLTVTPPMPPPSPPPAAAMPPLAAAPTAAATDPTADTFPAAQPLSGRIPLPRHRPRDLGAERIADMSPATIPVPRPRPDAAGAAAPAEEGGGNPLGFIQNLFH